MTVTYFGDKTIRLTTLPLSQPSPSNGLKMKESQEILRERKRAHEYEGWN